MNGLKKNSGFSLIELTIVIVILGMLSVVVYVRWHEETGVLYQQAAIFASDLRYTQNLSIAKNKRYRLKIIPPDSYQILDNTRTPVPLTLARGTTAILNKPISFGTITNITDTIIFNGKGVPYKDTTPEQELLADVTVVLQNTLGQTVTVTIARKTGEITK